jgi:lipopolysaccharide transport system ATP-binding protein
MSSEVLISQVPVTDRDRSDSTAVGDDVAISVRNVGKMYYLYDRPQDRLKQAFLWGRKKLYREFWALRDISFEVKRGETVGIIGQNGSGKSTLLQVVSGTLTPTTGEVRVNGRVAALLELGSGFNFEFTGRENVYMNGAILGLSHAEMDARFDEIVAFADIGQFIDQPLKTYSSGMVVRLAFACAINVDPDILIVDEVLAVGDIMFQSRCFERIQRMMESGVTTLLVTHDLNAFQMLCSYGYMLDGGTIYTQGKPKQVGLQYYEMMREREHTRQALAQASDDEKRRQAEERLQSKHAEIRERTEEDEYRWGTGTAQITDFKIFDHEGHETESLESGRPFKIWIQVEFYGDVANPVFSVMFRNVMNQNLFGMHTYLMDRIDFGPQHQGDVLCVEFENNMWLNPSEYLLQIGVGDFRTEYDYDSLDVLNRAAKIDVYGPKLSYGVVHSTARIRTVSPDAPPDPTPRPHYVILDDPKPVHRHEER